MLRRTVATRFFKKRMSKEVGSGKSQNFEWSVDNVVDKIETMQMDRSHVKYYDKPVKDRLLDRLEDETELSEQVKSAREGESGAASKSKLSMASITEKPMFEKTFDADLLKTSTVDDEYKVPPLSPNAAEERRRFFFFKVGASACFVFLAYHFGGQWYRDWERREEEERRRVSDEIRKVGLKHAAELKEKKRLEEALAAAEAKVAEQEKRLAEEKRRAEIAAEREAIRQKKLLARQEKEKAATTVTATATASTTGTEGSKPAPPAPAKDTASMVAVAGVSPHVPSKILAQNPEQRVTVSVVGPQQVHVPLALVQENKPRNEVAEAEVANVVSAVSGYAEEDESYVNRPLHEVPSAFSPFQASRSTPLSIVTDVKQQEKWQNEKEELEAVRRRHQTPAAA